MPIRAGLTNYISLHNIGLFHYFLTSKCLTSKFQLSSMLLLQMYVKFKCFVVFCADQINFDHLYTSGTTMFSVSGNSKTKLRRKIIRNNETFFTKQNAAQLLKKSKKFVQLFSKMGNSKKSRQSAPLFVEICLVPSKSIKKIYIFYIFMNIGQFFVFCSQNMCKSVSFFMKAQK